MEKIKLVKHFTEKQRLMAKNDSYHTEEYRDPTYYDKEKKSLDLGFQKIKAISSINKKNHFTNLKILFIASNALTDLPENLDQLEILHCQDNFIQEVPYYPSLKELYAMNNKIPSLNYDDHINLRTLDISGNIDFDLGLSLPNVKQLIANKINLRKMNGNFPNLKVLAIGENKLEKIYPIDSLVELTINHNRLVIIPSFVNLKILIANNNNISKIDILEKLEIAYLNDNQIYHINFPMIKKLIIHHNPLTKIGDSSQLIELDASYTLLTRLPNSNFDSLIIYQSKIKSLPLNSFFFDSLKELHIDYHLYRDCYDFGVKYFKNIELQINRKKMNKCLSKLDLNDKQKDLIKSIIYSLNFNNYLNEIHSITNVREFQNTLESIYHKSLQVYITFKS